MSTSEYYEFLRIETFVLKVHMNCQGCTNKVRKVLRKIEGVYKVEINAEQQKVTVMGSVDISTLIKKLAKLRKHVEIWNEDYNQEQVNLVEDNDETQLQDTINDYNVYSRDQPEHLDEPLFMNDVNNINHGYFNKINGNLGWEESNVQPTSFQENNGIHYSHLGSQQSAQNFYGVSPIAEYRHQLSPIVNIHGYYHNYHTMHQYNYDHLPQGIPFVEMPTTNYIMNVTTNKKFPT